MSVWTIAFWAAVAMLVDAGIGLWGLPYWQRLMPSWNIRRIAFIESLAALLILTAYFLFGR